MNNTIIVRFVGGLGNQLFQYSYYKWLEIQYPEKEILADLSEFEFDRPHDSAFFWEIFKDINIKKANRIQLFKASGYIPKIYGGKGSWPLNKLRTMINSSLLEYKGLFLDIYHNQPEDTKRIVEDGITYLEGYWQNLFYYDFLQKKVGPFKFLIDKEIRYQREIRESNAVAVHVRRGDYVGSEYEKDCGIEYYTAAIQYMMENIENPHFFFFSDDPEYVRNTYNWLEKKTIVQDNIGQKSYYDMFLMSCCPNCILANSTFSIWAAYLNKNKNQIVVYPDVFFVKKMVKPEWVPISV
ncbi:MAG: alpha-1,2-fucosyltransferase [Butyrivibrio sp.]|nr:alpha-1,2-fucosyltransferase [Butyrivibrio sp.]